VVGDDIMLRHALRLTEALDRNEHYEDYCQYEGPLSNIINAARLLGRQLAGHDDDF
jgi:hypothetical protein